MEQTRKHTYWLLLPVCVLLLLSLLVCTVGRTQSRYTTVTGWQMALTTQQAVVESNLLTAYGQTVLLDLPVEESRIIPLSLSLSGASYCSGTLTCEIEAGEEYLEAVFSQSEIYLDDQAATATLTLTPTAQALALTTAETAALRISWVSESGEPLQAEFYITLRPAESAEDEDSVAAETTAEDSWVTGMENFAPDGLLALRVNAPDGCDKVLLTAASGEPFPAMTRYSTDGGSTYTLLYDGGTIELAGSSSVLLDCSRADISSVVTDDCMAITASALSGQTVVSSCSFDTMADLKLPSVVPEKVPAIVTEDAPLVIYASDYYGTSSAEVHRLFSTENEGTGEAMPEIIVQDGIVLITSADGQARPGTYRLALTWNYEDIQIARREIVFYVNYTAYVDQD